jgi:ribosome maturation factor RimP
MSSSTPPQHTLDRAAFQRVVEPIAHAHGAEVVDIQLKPERGGWVLRVCVEKAGAAVHNLSTRDAAVNLELCANISRDLSPALDVADLVAHAYHLEVSSPGIERPLRGERDFVRFAGQKAKLKLGEAVDGQRVLIGVLDGVADGKVRVRVGTFTHEVTLSSVESARLVFEFGSNGKGRPHARAERGSGRTQDDLPHARAERGSGRTQDDLPNGRDTTQTKH